MDGLTDGMQLPTVAGPGAGVITVRAPAGAKGNACHYRKLELVGYNGTTAEPNGCEFALCTASVVEVDHVLLPEGEDLAALAGSSAPAPLAPPPATPDAMPAPAPTPAMMDAMPAPAPEPQATAAAAPSSSAACLRVPTLMLVAAVLSAASLVV